MEEQQQENKEVKQEVKEAKEEKKEEKKELGELEMELLKMNIKREQSLSAQEAGKYRKLKKEVARMKSKLSKSK